MEENGLHRTNVGGARALRRKSARCCMECSSFKRAYSRGAGVVAKFRARPEDWTRGGSACQIHQRTVDTV